MGWLEFCLAFICFFAAHNIPTRPHIKTALQRLIGARGFTWGYSILSLAVLYWLLLAAGRAPVVILWYWQPWQSAIPLIMMMPVCLLLGLSLGRPNPFSFGGAQNDQFDPRKPGLIRITRHPVLMALALWSLAHIVPNGALAHVLLFGIFAFFALLGMRLLDRRKKRQMQDWQQQIDRMKGAALWHSPTSWVGLLLRIGISVLGYIALLHTHGPLLGAYPIG